MAETFDPAWAERRMNELRAIVMASDTFEVTIPIRMERMEIEAAALRAGYTVRLYGLTGFKVEPIEQE